MLTDTTFWIDLAEERAMGQGGPAHQFLADRRHSTDLGAPAVAWLGGAR